MSVSLFLLLVLAPLALGVTAFIVWPLLRPGRPTSAAAADDPAAAVNRAIVAERRLQLDLEVAGLAPDSPERARRVAEFSRAALADLGVGPAGADGTGTSAPNIATADGPGTNAPSTATADGAGTNAPSTATDGAAATVPGGAGGGARRRLVAGIALAALLLAAPLAGYRLFGTPEWLAISDEAARGGSDVAALAAELERRMASRPDDPEGWLLLGRTRLALGDIDAARAALERALALDGRDPAMAAQIRVDLADAIARGDGAQIAGRPSALIAEALNRDPRNPKGLALAGAFAAAGGDPATARRHWQQLLALLPAGSDQARQVEGLLAHLPESEGRPATAPRATAPQDPASRSVPADGGSGAAAVSRDSGSRAATAARGSGSETATEPRDREPAAAAAAARVTGRIELDPALAERVAPTDTVFVVARALSSDDSPVGPPVAAIRAAARDLPLDFSLDDGNAMTPAATLSRQPRVMVVARISRSGTASAAPGDIEGRSAPVANTARDVGIRLDRVLP
jgi:cytochrome c-type biogenesis protein CcmH